MFLAALALTGCKKDGIAPAVNREDTRLDVRFVFTDRDLPLGQDRFVRDFVNTLCRVDELGFMLSGTTALDDHGMPIGSWPAVHIVADLASPQQTTMLGRLDPGELHYLDVRLGPSDPHAPPTGALCDTTAGDPRWSALVVKGVVDSNDDDHITPEDQPFVIRCALPAEQEMFRIHAHTSVTEGMTATLMITVDVHALFHGIDIADEPQCIAPSLFNRQALANLTSRVLGEPN